MEARARVVLQQPGVSSPLRSLDHWFVTNTVADQLIGAAALTPNAPSYLEVGCLGISKEAILVAPPGSVVAAQGKRAPPLTHSH